jgi:hypothetical protein
MSASLKMTGWTHSLSLWLGQASVWALISKQFVRNLLNFQLIRVYGTGQCGHSRSMSVRILGITMRKKTDAPSYRLTAVTTDYCDERLYNHYPLMTPELHFHRTLHLTSREMVNAYIGVRQGNRTVSKVEQSSKMSGFLAGLKHVV